MGAGTGFPDAMVAKAMTAAAMETMRKFMLKFCSLCYDKMWVNDGVAVLTLSANNEGSEETVYGLAEGFYAVSLSRL
jgi:hypothetical protein